MTNMGRRPPEQPWAVAGGSSGTHSLNTEKQAPCVCLCSSTDMNMLHMCAHRDLSPLGLSVKRVQFSIRAILLLSPLQPPEHLAFFWSSGLSKRCSDIQGTEARAVAPHSTTWRTVLPPGTTGPIQALRPSTQHPGSRSLPTGRMNSRKYFKKESHSAQPEIRLISKPHRSDRRTSVMTREHYESS